MSVINSVDTTLNAALTFSIKYIYNVIKFLLFIPMFDHIAFSNSYQTLDLPFPVQLTVSPALDLIHPLRFQAINFLN